MFNSKLILVLTVVSLVLFSTLFSCTSAQNQQASLPTELRGVWLTNVDSHVLESRASIAEAMQFLADHNFNIVYPVVWNKAATLYRSDVMNKYFNLEIDTLAAYKGRDPLAEVIEEAHKRKIAVIPWFEFGFSSSYNDNGGHILRTKPHWAARDREGKLLKKNGFEWMNAFHPEVQEFVLALVTEVVKKYDIDGIQGDDRLPAQPIEGGYDSLTVAFYEETHGGIEPPSDCREPQWKYWRAGRLNSFAQELYRRVKALKSDVVVSWSPSIYPWSLDEYLQDWRSWINLDSSGNNYADIIHPQDYRYNIEEYKTTLDTQHRDSMRVNTKKQYLYPGILLNVGKYLMGEEYLKQAVQYNRLSGYNGEVFFFYEGLRKEDGKMAKVLKENFYKTPARLPFTPAFLKSK